MGLPTLPPSSADYFEIRVSQGLHRECLPLPLYCVIRQIYRSTQKLHDQNGLQNPYALFTALQRRSVLHLTPCEVTRGHCVVISLTGQPVSV